MILMTIKIKINGITILIKKLLNKIIIMIFHLISKNNSNTKHKLIIKIKIINKDMINTNSIRIMVSNLKILIYINQIPILIQIVRTK